MGTLAALRCLRAYWLDAGSYEFLQPMPGFLQSNQILMRMYFQRSLGQRPLLATSYYYNDQLNFGVKSGVRLGALGPFDISGCRDPTCTHCIRYNLRPKGECGGQASRCSNKSCCMDGESRCLFKHLKFTLTFFDS